MFKSAKFTGFYEFLIFLIGEISHEFSALSRLASYEEPSHSLRAEGGLCSGQFAN
jgi:hypothetical protein